jgi:CheY-like chemotaxis protein
VLGGTCLAQYARMSTEKPAYLSERWLEPPPPRVLLVDDDAGMRRATSRALQHAGFEVVVLASAAEAIAALDAGAIFDAVVTDYEMPAMDGIELLQTLRARWPDLPAGIFSASEHLGRLSREELAGARFVKQKARPIGELIQAVCRAIYMR